MMIEKLKTEDFDRFYAIIEQSFPLDEHRTYEEHKALTEEQKYTAYVAEDVCGLITVYDFDEFVYVEHFAVAPECRGSGLGSEMLRWLCKKIGRRICLEVEPPETEFAKRRIAFYQRNGFTLNNYPYIQPPISAGRKAIPLMIMTSGGGVTQDEFLQIKDVLYKEVYHISDI